jgi:hypothetical protein
MRLLVCCLIPLTSQAVLRTAQHFGGPSRTHFQRPGDASLRPGAGWSRLPGCRRAVVRRAVHSKGTIHDVCRDPCALPVRSLRPFRPAASHHARCCQPHNPKLVTASCPAGNQLVGLAARSTEAGRSAAAWDTRAGHAAPGQRLGAVGTVRRVFLPHRCGSGSSDASRRGVDLCRRRPVRASRCLRQLRSTDPLVHPLAGGSAAVMGSPSARSTASSMATKSWSRTASRGSSMSSTARER